MLQCQGAQRRILKLLTCSGPFQCSGIGPSYVFNRAMLFCKICKSNIFLTIGKIAVSFLVSGDFGVCDLSKDELSWATQRNTCARVYTWARTHTYPRSPRCCLLFRCYVLSDCNPMDCSRPGFPVLHCLPELAHVRVHRVGDAI